LSVRRTPSLGFDTLRLEGVLQLRNLVEKSAQGQTSSLRAQGTRRDPAADRSHGRVAHPRYAGRALVEGALMRRFMEVARPKLWARAVQEDV
jgi:hypothetical protein